MARQYATHSGHGNSYSPFRSRATFLPCSQVFSFFLPIGDDAPPTQTESPHMRPPGPGMPSRNCTPAKSTLRSSFPSLTHHATSWRGCPGVWPPPCPRIPGGTGVCRARSCSGPCCASISSSWRRQLLGQRWSRVLQREWAVMLNAAPAQRFNQTTVVDG